MNPLDYSPRVKNYFSVVIFSIEGVFEKDLWFYTVEEKPVKTCLWLQKYKWQHDIEIVGLFIF